MTTHKPWILGMLLAGITTSQTLIADNFCGYARDSRGGYAVDSRGQCIYTTRWNKAAAAKQCDPQLFPEPEPEVVHVAEPVHTPEPAPAPKISYNKISLSADAHFDYDQATLKPAGRASLTAFVSRLRQYESIDSIMAVGHTDSRGSERYNQGLSERRALAVKDFLAQQGVNPAIIRTQGQGESNPIASNDTDAGRADNRRVEIVIGVVEKTVQ